MAYTNWGLWYRYNKHILTLVYGIHSGYLLQFAMERSNPFLVGKPSISIRAIYTMAMLNNQGVDVTILSGVYKPTFTSLGGPHIVSILSTKHGFCSVKLRNHEQRLGM